MSTVISSYSMDLFVPWVTDVKWNKAQLWENVSTLVEAMVLSLYGLGSPFNTTLLILMQEMVSVQFRICPVVYVAPLLQPETPNLDL